MSKPPRAFPTPYEQFGGGLNCYEGMSLRDYFAGQALMAMGPEAIEALTRSVGEYTPDKVDRIIEHAARMSYRFADAMLKERAK